MNALRTRAARRDEAGFTLIELLVVIAILGILATIAVFSVAGITDRGTEACADSNVANAKVAVQAYYAQEGSYPTANSELASFFDGGVPAGLINYGSATTAPTYNAVCP